MGAAVVAVETLAVMPSVAIAVRDRIAAKDALVPRAPPDAAANVSKRLRVKATRAAI